MVDGLISDGWFLSFYDFRDEWEPVDDVLPGFGDIVERARRNGARDGTPFYLNPAGRAVPQVNAFWRAPGVRGLAKETQRRYAFSLKLWLDFLYAVGVEWDRVTPSELAGFKQWRLSAEDNPDHVAPGSFRTDLAAIRRFYLWAAQHAGVDNPVQTRVVGRTLSGDVITSMRANPSGIRRSDVKWLTPQAFRLWRNLGLRGFSADGLPTPSWKGGTEDRDVAYAEGLFGTGLRNAEWASVLTVELPQLTHRGLLRARLAAACAKGSVGRTYWMRRRVGQLVSFYQEEGGRSAAVARAQQAGRYHEVADRWLVRHARPDGVLDVIDEFGQSRSVHVDVLGPELRMRLFTEGLTGVEPLWLWLNHDGTPRPKQAWNKTFDRANQRVTRVLAAAGRDAALWCRPHMLRHSFALRWYCVATFVAWARTDTLTERERRDFRDQLGDVWYLMATLLGHTNPQTTREVYLEPFRALDVERMVAVMDADDRDALQRLVDVVAAGQPRVLTGAWS